MNILILQALFGSRPFSLIYYKHLPLSLNVLTEHRFKCLQNSPFVDVPLTESIYNCRTNNNGKKKYVMLWSSPLYI